MNARASRGVGVERAYSRARWHDDIRRAGTAYCDGPIVGGLCRRVARERANATRIIVALALIVCWAAPVAAASMVDSGTPVSRPSSELVDKSAKVTYPPILAIEIVGNKITRRHVILQEMLVKAGDPADPRRIAQSRQAIMDLGLFSSVQADLLPGQGGDILRITVKEKHYFLPLPRLDRNSEGDITYGFDVKMDNLAGLNQHLDISRKTKDYADGAGTERSTSLDYSYPRMFGSPYQVDFSADRTDLPQANLPSAVAGTSASYAHRSANVRAMLSRWLNVGGPSRGWRFGGGVVWHRQEYRPLAGVAVPPGYAGETYGLLASVSYQNVRDLVYTRSGVSYGYDLEAGGKFTGSDYSYLRQVFYYRRYMPITSVPYRNINVNLGLGLSTGRLFNGDAFGLGGSDSLRGYQRSVIAGKSFVLANIEYLTPILGQRALRGVVFLDIGNAYRTNQGIDLTDLYAGGGIGLRWKLKTFVNADLRLDIAYANSVDGVKIYAGTKAPF